MNKSIVRVFLFLVAIFLFVLMVRPPIIGPSEKRVGVGEFISRIDTGDIISVTAEGTEFRGKLAGAGDQQLVTYADSAREEVIKALRDKKVPFEERMPSQMMGLLMNILPYVLIGIVVIFLFSRIGNAGQKAASNFGSSKVTMHRPTDKDKVTFADVAGVDEVKEELSEVVQFLKNPQQFSSLGGRMPKGILMMGPPGTGKTLLAKAVAGEAGVPFLQTEGSAFVEMFVGVGASRARDVFAQARKNAPCILFIDEFDGVGRKRAGATGLGGNDEREQTLNQFLAEMDGFDPNDGVIMMAATNRPEVLDEALMRPGRFDRHVVVPKPDLMGRKAIIEVHLRKYKDKVDPAVDPMRLARSTPGLVGADLEAILNEAAVHAGKLKKARIEEVDIAYGKDKVTMGTERKSLIMPEHEKRTTAVHEIGHALIGWLTPGADPVDKVTIIPRGQALGMTMFLPLEDRFSHSKEFLFTQMDVALGGRAAEHLIFTADKVTTGASNDLDRVRNIVHRMVCDWGMSELGLLTFRSQEQTFLHSEGSSLDCSQEMAAKIDDVKRKIVEQRWHIVMEKLKENKEKLLAAAELLFNQETLEAGDLLKIFGPPAKVTA